MQLQFRNWGEKKGMVDQESCVGDIHDAAKTCGKKKARTLRKLRQK